MRNGKRNWLIALLIAGEVVFILGQLSNRHTPTAEASVDTRTTMERYVSAYSQYTQAQLERFKEFQSTINQSNAEDFFATMLRIALATAVAIGAYNGFRASRALMDSMDIKANLVSTPYGIFWLDKDNTGKKIPRRIDKPVDEPSKQTKTEVIPVYHNDEKKMIEFKNGKVVDVLEDESAFLEKAIEVNGSHSKELPHHDKMGVSGEKWSAVVHDRLGGLFTVENRGDGMRTYCTAYPDLGSTYFAVKNKKAPLPEKKKTKKT